MATNEITVNLISTRSRKPKDYDIVPFFFPFFLLFILMVFVFFPCVMRSSTQFFENSPIRVHCEYNI